MIKFIILAIISFTYSNSFSQNLISYDIYILFKLKSDANLGQDFDNNSKYERYNLSWESKSTTKTLKVDENGQLIKGGISVANRSPNFLILTYTNLKNENPKLKIPNKSKEHPLIKGLVEKELYKNRNVIRFEEFMFYDQSELLNVIKNAKNIYVVFEEEKNKKYYFAKKVTIK